MLGFYFLIYANGLIMIDFHCHSYFSDGLLSPEELLQQALNNGVTKLALTDHDTIAGLSRLHTAAYNKPITVINGIEVSTRWAKYDLHIIGLQFDCANADLRALIERQTATRITRAIAIGKRLTAIGVSDSYEKACLLAGHERVGRPHFAQVLVNEGFVSDIQQAFKKFLGHNRSAYVPILWPSLEEVVAVIHAASGVAVIAHPLKYSLTRTVLNELIKNFKAIGGVGLEVVSGQIADHNVKLLAEYCVRYKLLASTGSDYHGDGLSYVGIGKQQALPESCAVICS